MKMYNPEIFKRIYEIFKLKGEGAQEEIDLIANISIEPYIKSISAIAPVNAANAAITFPADKQIYIVGYDISVQKNATSTATNIQVTCTIDNRTSQLTSEESLTLTAKTMTRTSDFKYPMKIDKGSQIAMYPDSVAAGDIKYSVTIRYYEE